MTTTQETAPDMSAMMEAWAKYATPSDGHKNFEKLVGKWTAEMKYWMDPAAPPDTSNGTTEFRTIFGGRYLIQDYHGEAMGQPFEGMGIFGFDNNRRQHYHIWLDNMGTAMMVSRSPEGVSGETIEYHATHDDCMTGRKDVATRAVAKFVDGNTHTFDMYTTAPDGSEFKNMEIVYKRV